MFFSLYNRNCRLFINIFLILGLTACVTSDPVISKTPLENLNQKLENLTWLAYAPTGFDPTIGQFPSEESIYQDLLLAKQYGFSGIITYALDGTLVQIPRIAKELGFKGVIAGIFMFNEEQKQTELANAKLITNYVDGWSIGNEGLIGCGGSLYTADDLLAVFGEIREISDKPVSTSEQFEDYENACNNNFLVNHGDWLMPIIQPFNNNQVDPLNGAAFVKEKYENSCSFTPGFSL